MKPFLQQRTRLPLVAATAATLIASAPVWPVIEPCRQ